MKTKQGYVSKIDIDEFLETDLSFIEFAIFNYIRGFKNGYYSTVTNISYCFRIHRKTAKKCLENLIKKGYIEIKNGESKKALYLCKIDQNEMCKNDRDVSKNVQAPDKNDHWNGQKYTTNNNINNNYYNYSYNKSRTQKENRSRASYDIDEFMRRAINDPIIYVKKNDGDAS